MTGSAVVRFGLFLAVGLGGAAAALSAQAASGQGAPAAAPPPQLAPVPRPTLAEAQQMLMTAQAAAAKMNVGLSCAVVDARGDLIALSRMDGVSFLTVDVARGKAVTSVLLGQPSGSLGPLAPIIQSLSSVTDTRMLPIQGALPIVRANQTIGAVGCSGASAQQDEDAARAGIQAVMK